MAIIGAIALTIAFGYIALFFLAIAIPPLIGFDEYNIPAGLMFLAFACVPCVAWWFVVGSNISISVTV